MKDYTNITGLDKETFMTGVSVLNTDGGKRYQVSYANGDVESNVEYSIGNETAINKRLEEQADATISSKEVLVRRQKQGFIGSILCGVTSSAVTMVSSYYAPEGIQPVVLAVSGGVFLIGGYDFIAETNDCILSTELLRYDVAYRKWSTYDVLVPEQKGGRRCMVGGSGIVLGDNLILAGGVNYSVFKQAMGQTISSYLSQQRLLHAQELLQDISIPIKDVCARSGYEDPHYFARSFKKQTGMTPSEYRNLYSSRDLHPNRSAKEENI